MMVVRVQMSDELLALVDERAGDLNAPRASAIRRLVFFGLVRARDDELRNDTIRRGAPRRRRLQPRGTKKGSR